MTQRQLLPNLLGLWTFLIGMVVVLVAVGAADLLPGDIDLIIVTKRWTFVAAVGFVVWFGGVLALALLRIRG